MDKVVKRLLDNINNTNNKEEIEAIIDEFDMKKYSSDEVKKITVAMLGCIDILEGRRVFDLLEVLYKSNNKRKFDLFCYLFFELSEDLAIIPRIDKYKIASAKLKAFMPVLISVLIKTNNSIANILMNILIENYKSYNFNKEEKLAITNTVEKRMEIILKRNKENDGLSSKDIKTLETAIDLAKNFENDYILEMILDCLEIENDEIRLYSLVTLLKHDVDFDDKYIEAATENLQICTRFFDELRENNILEYFPQKKLTQEYLAKIEFIKWLEDKSSVKSAPDEIEYQTTYKENRLVYFVFKFKHIELGKDWKIGISGGYLEKYFPTVKNTKETFSCYEKYKERNYKKQVAKILEESRKIIEEENIKKEKNILKKKSTEKDKNKIEKSEERTKNKLKKRNKENVTYNIF